MAKEKAAREEKMVEEPTPKKQQKLTGAEEIRKLSEDYEYNPAQSAQPASPEEQADSNQEAADQGKK